LQDIVLETERIKMVVRKKYDHWGIEITTWNKTNVVAYVVCDCGHISLARRELRKYNHFKCSSCKKKEYKLSNGSYIEIGAGKN
jgi:small-conductance mechanosensitive channel